MIAEQAYYWMATFALPVAAGWALVTWGYSIGERRQQLRWQQAEAAWKSLDKTFEDPETRIAFQVIDAELDVIEIPGEGPVEITLEEAMTALDPVNPPNTMQARLIRHSFDAVLYAMDRLAIAIESGYVLEEDVLSPTTYYARRLHELREHVYPYASSTGYERALRLIERFAQRTQQHPSIGT